MDLCPSIRHLVFAVAEGEASPADAMRVARHVSDCTGCRILIAREDRLARMLEHDLEDVPVGEEFVQSVMANLPGELPRRRPLLSRRRGLKLAGLVGLLGAGTLATLAKLSLPAAPLALMLPKPGPDSAETGLRAILDMVRLVVAAIEGVALHVPVDLPSASGALVAGALIVPAAFGFAALSAVVAYAAVRVR